jgi:hypothetical protein
MPLQDIVVSPGVNTQVTLAQNQAGVSVSQLLRYKEGLPQKLGGWTQIYPFSVASSPVRDIHAFQGLRSSEHFVGIGALTALKILYVSTQASSLSVLTDITPQAFQSNVAVSLSIASGSCLVTVTDAGSSMSVYGGVRFDTPVAVGNLLITGAYPIFAVLNTNTYEIASSITASTTISSGGQLPQFYTSSGSAFVGVLLPNNGYQSKTGLFYPFTAATSVGGITIQGPYQVTSIIDSTNFFIGSQSPATATVSSAAPVTMNSTLMSIYHYVAIGPQPSGSVYGSGLYGSGNYGQGAGSPAGASSTITVTDWLLDNWGEVLIACAENQAIYAWAPDVNLFNAAPILLGTAPLFNTGAFVTQPQQIIMAYGSGDPITGAQNQLLVRWCDSATQQGYNQWVANTTSFAGSFLIPVGSKLIGGINAPNYSVLWTDIDCWTASYVGQPLVWSFQRVGTGCGVLGKHAMDVQSGLVYWAGQSNFFMLGPQGVQVVPCTVWDFFFQQLDQSNAQKVRCASNAAYNEITWYFPVIGGNGENSAYVKVHIENTEFEWDYGFLPRTAWVDVTAVGMPLGTDQGGFLYQHETSNDAAGTLLNSALETGYFELGDGSGLVRVDWFLPDMKWNQTGGTTGTIAFTFFTVDYAGQPERTYGPYYVTQNIPYINLNMRGRFWRMRAENLDLGSFWRLGRCKFRWGYAGNR